MSSQRVIDRLVGAAVAVLVIVVAVLVFLWWVSEPADDGAGATPAPSASGSPGPGPGSGPAAPSEAPSDLAADETWLGEVALDAGRVLTPDSVLRDVSAHGQDVRSGPDGLRAGHLVVEATVPFETVAAQLGEGITVKAADGSQATVLRTVEVAGREFAVRATGTVEVDDGQLVVEPRAIDIGGPDVLARSIADVTRRLVTIRHDVEGVPDGMVLEDVTVRDDGFRARMVGQDVELTS